MLEGLDATILNLSEVKADNEKLRIDDGYFSKLAVLTQRRIEKLPHVRLGEACATFRKGIFDIKAESYVDEGVPFVHIGDLRGGLIDDSNLSFITEAAHLKEAATALVFGDVVLSKTAYAAASLVNLPRCNVCQDTIAVRIADAWKMKLPTGYLVTFLNTKYGLALLERQFQGNIQAHLSLPDGRKVPVPLFGETFQQAVHDMLLKADALHVQARRTIGHAQQTVVRKLGIDGWTPPDPLTYTSRISAALEANRIDSDYFAPARSATIAMLAAKPHFLLSDLCDSVRELFDPAMPQGIHEVRNFDLGEALKPSLDDSHPAVHVSEIGSTKKFIKRGDVVISRLRSYLQQIAVVDISDNTPTVGSTEFFVLRPRAGIAPELLMVFLRSQPVQTILKYCQEGNQHPRFSDNNLLSIPFPKLLLEHSDLIVSQVRDAKTTRQEARALLAKAKRAVEIAIEESEAAALNYLKEA